MSEHQHDPNAKELWITSRASSTWVKATFPNLSQGDEGDRMGTPLRRVQGRVAGPREDGGTGRDLMADSDVEKARGHLRVRATGDEKHLSIRQFDDNKKRRLRATAGPVCTDPLLTPGNSDGKKSSTSRRWKPTTSPRGQGRQDRCRQLPDALPTVQSSEGRQVERDERRAGDFRQPFRQTLLRAEQRQGEPSWSLPAARPAPATRAARLARKRHSRASWRAGNSPATAASRTASTGARSSSRPP